MLLQSPFCGLRQLKFRVIYFVFVQYQIARSELFSNGLTQANILFDSCHTIEWGFICATEHTLSVNNGSCLVRIENKTLARICCWSNTAGEMAIYAHILPYFMNFRPFRTLLNITTKIRRKNFIKLPFWIPDFSIIQWSSNRFRDVLLEVCNIDSLCRTERNF